MQLNCFLLPALLGLISLLTFPAFAAPPVTCVSVTDFGATVNDPKDDDAPAIEAAIKAASEGDTPCRAVFFPGGEYHVKTTINIPYQSHSIKLFGTGVRRAGWRHTQPKPTQINWNGPADGVLLEAKGVMGLRIEDMCLNGDTGFDGVDIAKIGINVLYEPGCPSGEFNFERVEITRCGTGFLCENEPCNSDMTFIDFSLTHCKVGFHTRGGQNVNYIFVRPGIICDETTPNTLGFWFENGSSVNMQGLTSGAVAKVVKIDKGDVNGGCFVFNEWKPELYNVANERPVLLDVGGYATIVYINGLCTGVRPETDTSPALINIRDNAIVNITASQLYMRKLAKVGDGNGRAMLVFDTCRFGGSDPRSDDVVTHDARSGYIVRDCEMNSGIINSRHDHAYVYPPAPPSDLVATPGAKQVTLSWKDNSDDEDGFSVSRLNNGAWQEIFVSPKSNITTVTDTDVKPGVTYMYKVSAIKGGVRGAACKQASAKPTE